MNRRGVTPEDLLAIAVPQDPQVSPDGRRVAYTVRTVNRDTRRSVIHLWIGEPGAEPRQLTSGPFRDTQPRWSPDGNLLAFVTTRSLEPTGKERTQLAVVPLAGGEPRVLTREDAAFGEPVWTPSGRLVFAMRKHDPTMVADPKSPAAIRVTRLTYKANGTGYLPQDRWHLYSLDPEDGGPPRPVTEGDWDDQHPVISQDGKWLAWTSNRREDRELDPENQDLWVMPLEGGTPRQLSTLRGGLHAPAFHPDGSSLVFLQSPGPRGNLLLDNTHVFAVPIDGSAPERNLTPELDRCALNLTMSDSIGIEAMASPPAFSPDGRHVVFLISENGRTVLARVPFAGGAVERLPVSGTVATLGQATPGGPLGLLITDHTNPGTIAVSTHDGRDLKQVADPNQLWCAEVSLAEPQELSVTPEGGVPIQAWLLKPDGPGPHPLLLYIHGGPVFQYGRGFFHELQMLRARGFAVLYGNPRGSQGYGRDFAWSIRRDWGTKPMIDLMALVDHALTQGDLDASRMGVLGGSYGGFMTLWIIAHTDRFKAANTQRPVSWLEGMIWSDFGGQIGDWWGSLPWEDPELYTRSSPLTYAARMNTPLLITQGLDDLRTPADQGERAFVTLKRLGKQVEMVLFPGADHDLSRKGRPEQRLARLEAIVEWMERHLRPGRCSTD